MIGYADLQLQITRALGLSEKACFKMTSRKKV